MPYPCFLLFGKQIVVNKIKNGSTYEGLPENMPENPAKQTQDMQREAPGPGEDKGGAIS